MALILDRQRSNRFAAQAVESEKAHSLKISTANAAAPLIVGHG
jgi:hypothetical protein